MVFILSFLRRIDVSRLSQNATNSSPDFSGFFTSMSPDVNILKKSGKEVGSLCFFIPTKRIKERNSHLLKY